MPPTREARGRFLRVAGLTLVLLVTVDVVLRATLPDTALLEDRDAGAVGYLAKLLQLEREPAPDVLVLGSSRVARAVIPDVMEAELARVGGEPAITFNLGLNNAKVAEYHALVNSHLPDPPPRFVILGFSGTEIVNENAFDVAPTALWRLPDCIDYLSCTPFGEVRLGHVKDFLLSELARCWYLFGRREELGKRLVWEIESLLGLISETDQRRREYLQRVVDAMLAGQKGYWEVPTEGPVRTLADRLRRNPDLVRVPPRDLRWPAEIVRGDGFILLRKVVAMLRDRGCMVALVETPPSPLLQRRNPVMHGTGLAPSRQQPFGVPGYRTRMEDFARELDVLFIPCDAASCGLTNDHFLDINHMTREGAVRYSRLLVQRLWDARYFEARRP